MTKIGTVHFVKDGVTLVIDGATYRMVASRHSTDYGGLKQAQRQAHLAAKKWSQPDRQFKVRLIPNTYIYGIFQPPN